MNEFQIIQHFFSQQNIQRDDVTLGIGDDAAIVSIPTNHQLVITADTLVQGVHFPMDTAAFDIGYKALAVNLSDLAAMGATPAWITLALTLNKADSAWLTDFSRGLFALTAPHQVQLIGGDLTSTAGPLTITIQAHGFVPTQKALRRDQAKPGDLIYVTHTLGDAAYAIELILQNKSVPEPFNQRLNRPEPQIAIGKQLRHIAHAVTDISDGLAADLGHILERSQVGAEVFVEQLPLSAELKQSTSSEHSIDLALNGGDDYELCFTVPHDHPQTFDFDCTCIGKITAEKGLVLQFNDGRKYTGSVRGYQHF